MISFQSFEQDDYEDHGPEITPLIDMVFLLLIFFLLTSYYSTPRITVDLPESEQGHILPESPLIITIRENGTILLDYIPLSLKELPSALRDILLHKKEKEVGLQVDGNVSFGKVVEIMDIAKKSGAVSVRFLVEKKPEGEA